LIYCLAIESSAKAPQTIWHQTKSELPNIFNEAARSLEATDPNCHYFEAVAVVVVGSAYYTLPKEDYN
jgi:hypothetical protein